MSKLLKSEKTTRHPYPKKFNRHVVIFGLRWRLQLFVLLLMGLWSGTVTAKDLPTAEQVLQIYHANRQQLSRLHLQVIHRFEKTEAAARMDLKNIAQNEKILKAVNEKLSEEISSSDANGQKLLMDEYRVIRASLEQDIRSLKKYGRTSFQMFTPMEFFIEGENYQYRTPHGTFKTAESVADWKFPSEPLTPESLLSTYKEANIYSRSSTETPPARWWHGSNSQAYIMKKHLGEVSRLSYPPFTDVSQPEWDRRHPIDMFFSQSAEKYDVVRQEEVDGRLLTLVEVCMPTNSFEQTWLCYRGWLDLKRGAIPLKLHVSQSSGGLSREQFERVSLSPMEVLRTEKILELPDGGFYPVVTIREKMSRDPDAPQQPPAEAGKPQTISPYAVYYRYHWEAKLVDNQKTLAADFFSLRFPEGQKIFDLDAGKIPGALDPKPPIQPGQPAPELQVARWLDGKPRSLKDFQGQVVVLDFWGLRSQASKNSVSIKKLLQEKYRDQPVVFLSIHTADEDLETLSQQVELFTREQKWNYLTAIDQGTMLENSVTANAFGSTSFSTEIIIGKDGLVKYNSSVLPAELMDLAEKSGDELTPRQEQRISDYMKKCFEQAGEVWPVDENLSKEEQAKIYERIELFMKSREIDAALSELTPVSEK